jgi:hypothetical protein
MDEVVTELRRRLVLLADGGDRRAIEDGIALLTDERLCGMDESRFETLLSMLRVGRSPAGHVLKPQLLARELTRRWQSYGAAARAAESN